MTPIASLPALRKPRERLQEEGVQALELEDLVAIILRTGTASEDVLSLSRHVVSCLLNGCASLVDLASIKGIGLIKATEIVAALHLRPALEQRLRGGILSSPAEIYVACQDLLEKPQEHLVTFFLTVRNQQICRETVTIGTASSSLVHPREVFRPAILRNASHIILAHNHPSGDPAPSRADFQATEKIVVAGRQVGIELIDHVICAKNGYVSLKSCAPELFS